MTATKANRTESDNSNEQALGLEPDEQTVLRLVRQDKVTTQEQLAYQSWLTEPQFNAILWILSQRNLVDAQLGFHSIHAKCTMEGSDDGRCVESDTAIDALSCMLSAHRQRLIIDRLRNLQFAAEDGKTLTVRLLDLLKEMTAIKIRIPLAQFRSNEYISTKNTLQQRYAPILCEYDAVEYNDCAGVDTSNEQTRRSGMLLTTITPSIKDIDLDYHNLEGGR